MVSFLSSLYQVFQEKQTFLSSVQALKTVLDDLLDSLRWFLPALSLRPDRDRE